MQRVAALVVTCASLTLSGSFAGYARLPGLPTIPVSVEVGLDEGTKSLLQSLPENLRVQFVKAVQQSLDTLDFHVDKYISDMQAAAAQTTQDVACVGEGLAANMGGDLVAGVTTLLIGDLLNLFRSGQFATPAGVDADLQALSKAIIDTQQALSGTATPEQLYATYSDLVFASAKLICKMRARNAPTTFGTDKLSMMRRAMGEWRILRTENACQTADSCVQKRREDIARIFASEPAILIAAASVQGEFDQLKAVPRAPATESGWQALSKRARLALGMSPPTGYDITKTESVLFGLRDVELKVAAVKSNWQWQASQE